MSEMADRGVKILRDIDLTVGTPNYYQVVRSIIESMREPTGDMIHAGLMAGCRINTVEGWRAMIDEASK